MKVVRQEINQGFTLAINTQQGAREFSATVPGTIHTDLFQQDLSVTFASMEQKPNKSGFEALIRSIAHIFRRF